MRVGLDARMANSTGIGRYIRNLVRELRPLLRDSEDTLVMLGRESPTDGSVQTLPAEADVFGFEEQIRVAWLASRREFDLFHSPQFNVPLLSGTSQVTTIHDCAYDRYPEEFPSVAARAYYRVMFPLALKRSDRLIAVSHATKDDLTELHDVPPEKIRVVWNGVDDKFFDPPFSRNGAQSYLRQALGLEENYYLYIGLNRPRKNLRRLLRAYRKVRNRNSDCPKLVIAGPRDNRFLDMGAALRELRLKGEVVVTGTVEEHTLLALYRAATSLVLPSLYEGFGLTALEAMAMGTPVVASRIRALEEVGGDATLSFDPRDVAELARVLEHVAASPRLRARLARKGRERASDFRWAETSRKTLEVYREVVAG